MDRVLATDLSEAMLDSLRSRLTGTHISNIELGRMAVEKLDVSDAAFDAAVCALGLMYTPDPAAAVAEMVRVVKPGGTVAATVWGERRNCGWASVFPIVDARVASEVCPNFFATGAQGTLAKLFENAGLEKVSEYRQVETITFESDNDVVDAVLLGGPVALAAKRFTGDVWNDVRQDFLLSVSSYKGADSSYRIPGEFLTVKGIRSGA
jgi:SAM-dependent methyltransferase